MRGVALSTFFQMAIFINLIAQSDKEFGEKIDFEVQVGREVTINAGKVILEGNLIAPSGSNESGNPAVVMVIGSGADSYKTSFRNGEKFPFWKVIADAFLEKGYFVLFIEKRGINGSEGTWRKYTIDERAKDAIAGVDYLRAQSYINSNKIGLVGHSQGGWVIQYAASKYPEKLSFIVNIAGATSSVLEQEVDNLSNDWRCAGMDERKVSRKAKALRFKLKVFKGISSVIKINGFSYLIGFNPKKHLPKITCPVLAIYGVNDRLVPIEANMETMKQGIADRNLLSIIEIDGVTHGFFEGPLCYDPKVISWKIVPELFQSIQQWKHLPL